MQGVYAGVAVILEKLLKRVPEVRGGGVVVGDEIEKLGGDAGVDQIGRAHV